MGPDRARPSDAIGDAPVQFRRIQPGVRPLNMRAPVRECQAPGHRDAGAATNRGGRPPVQPRTPAPTLQPAEPDHQPRPVSVGMLRPRLTAGCSGAARRSRSIQTTAGSTSQRSGAKGCEDRSPRGIQLANGRRVPTRSGCRAPTQLAAPDAATASSPDDRNRARQRPPKELPPTQGAGRVQRAAAATHRSTGAPSEGKRASDAASDRPRGLSASDMASDTGRLPAQMPSQTRRITRVPLVPPNPNEFFIATSIFISRAVVGAVVEIALRVLVEDVDRRRRHLVVHREHGQQRLEAAGARRAGVRSSTWSS